MIHETHNKELILEILNLPRILDLLGEDKIQHVNLNHLWLVYTDNHKIKGIIELKEFNKITVEAHIIVLPEFHGTNISSDFSIEVFKYLSKNTIYRNILAPVPVSCVHIIKFLNKLNFKVIGLMKESIIWKHNLQDLLLYQYNIKEGGI